MPYNRLHELVLWYMLQSIVSAVADVDAHQAP